MASNNKKMLSMSLAALGVVYGDLGTSPLYAIRESLQGLPINHTNILGVLSLIFWALILVISTCYLTVILRADNDGEGGVLALLALLKKNKKIYSVLLFVGIIGAGLLMGDGMLTPAISVLSAIEGLQIFDPNLKPFVIPITLAILITLFMVQRFGTGKIGISFGPILLFWFMVIAALGAVRIFKNPEVLYAINPYYAYEFFRDGGWAAYALLGGVFLVITGAEALYADLGHFGKTPIRIGWYAVALPGLLLNYFGQGAYLLQFPKGIENPFYAMLPMWSFYPMLILAAVATIIASQAIISATFSITKQAVLLNLCPRIFIKQTSEEEKGQIYVPKVNFVLAVGTVILVLTFKNATALAGAFGLAVNLVMVGVATMVMFVAYYNWAWSIPKIIRVFFVFVIIDLAFLGGSLHKFLVGGWVPITFALICATIMITWYKGMAILRSSFYKEKTAFKGINEAFEKSNLQHVPNLTAIFITDPYDQSGGGFLHYLKLIRIKPERIMIVSTIIMDRPYMPDTQRFDMKKISENAYHLNLNYGFMQLIDIPKTLTLAERMNIFPFEIHIEQAVFLVENINAVLTQRKYPRLYAWQQKLFIFFLRNSALDIDFFQLPYNRTLSIGTYCEI